MMEHVLAKAGISLLEDVHVKRLLWHYSKYEKDAREAANRAKNRLQRQRMRR